MKVSAQSCVKNDTYNIFLQKNANMLQNILLVGLGSMAGGVARYLLSMWIKQILPSLFPWGTFIVNMSGCLIIGLLSGWLSSQPLLPIHHRLLFIIGFCGSFTTFSTFTMDNLNLLTRIIMYRHRFLADTTLVSKHLLILYLTVNTGTLVATIK